MPIYEFRCSKCGSGFELRRLFSAATLPAKCPTCGGKGDRLLSVFASTDSSSLHIPAKAPLRARPASVKAAKPTRRKAAKAR